MRLTHWRRRTEEVELSETARAAFEAYPRLQVGSDFNARVLERHAQNLLAQRSLATSPSLGGAFAETPGLRPGQWLRAASLGTLTGCLIIAVIFSVFRLPGRPGGPLPLGSGNFGSVPAVWDSSLSPQFGTFGAPQPARLEAAEPPNWDTP